MHCDLRSSSHSLASYWVFFVVVMDRLGILHAWGWWPVIPEMELTQDWDTNKCGSIQLFDYWHRKGRKLQLLLPINSFYVEKSGNLNVWEWQIWHKCQPLTLIASRSSARGNIRAITRIQFGFTHLKDCLWDFMFIGISDIVSVSDNSITPLPFSTSRLGWRRVWRIGSSKGKRFRADHPTLSILAFINYCQVAGW